ncbi:MAG: (Fe-S)-binding protein, partial [Thermodesulfobacteriota bacterium]
YANILQNCLLCLACEQVCSSSVSMHTVVLRARQELVSQKGLSWKRRQMHSLLQGRSRKLKALFQAGALVQRLLLKRVPEESGLRLRFPLPGLDQDQLLPRLALRPFRDRYPQRFGSREQELKVVFFTGCASNYLLPEIGESLLKVLNALGVGVDIPKSQSCCGAPVLAAGDRKGCISLAEENLQTLGKLDPEARVVVCCASGGFMLKQIYPELLRDRPALLEQARDLAARTLDISQYLVQVIGLQKLKAKIASPCSISTTFHDPCHLVRGQGVQSEPRRLLEICCPGHFQEMQDADSCCGLGGTYAVTHKDMSQRIRQQKLDNIYKAQAGQVVTGCPACMLQLRAGLQQKLPRVQVRHTIQVLSRAMGLEE